jgi:hypothetical protein
MAGTQKKMDGRCCPVLWLIQMRPIACINYWLEVSIRKTISIWERSTSSFRENELFSISSCRTCQSVAYKDASDLYFNLICEQNRRRSVEEKVLLQRWQGGKMMMRFLASPSWPGTNTKRGPHLLAQPCRPLWIQSKKNIELIFSAIVARGRLFFAEMQFKRLEFDWPAWSDMGDLVRGTYTQESRAHYKLGWNFYFSIFFAPCG